MTENILKDTLKGSMVIRASSLAILHEAGIWKLSFEDDKPILSLPGKIKVLLEEVGEEAGEKTFKAKEITALCANCKKPLVGEEINRLPYYKRTAMDLDIQDSFNSFCTDCAKLYVLQPALDCPGIKTCPIVTAQYPMGIELTLLPEDKPLSEGCTINVPKEIFKKLTCRDRESIRVVIMLSPSSEKKE